MLSIYSYLSKGVVVPESQKRFAPSPYLSNGKYFDWHHVVSGLIRVESSKKYPSNSYISIYYRKHYFYIRDDDDNSKEALNLLILLDGIFQGDMQSVLPVFTVS